MGLKSAGRFEGRFAEDLKNCQFLSNPTSKMKKITIISDKKKVICFWIQINYCVEERVFGGGAKQTVGGLTRGGGHT